MTVEAGRKGLPQETHRPSDGVHVGRAGEDGVRNQGWLLGHFMPEGDLLHSGEVEVKWGIHPPGDRRAAWATHETRTALLVLISGSFDIELRDRTVVLRQPGDYVVWGPGQDHSWQAGDQETVVLTVRWPSLPGWRLPPPPGGYGQDGMETDGNR